MDTKRLERFATWARRELINAVEAQATAVLAVGSVARSERAEVIRKLEAEIAHHGRQQVVDKVAYIWFNRIVALRFMDARGYTDAGVVSPAQGQAHGQPEILADAKRGNLDTDVVTNSRTANAIIGLLDGTRRSTNAEGEAYALLLTEYCRYWHKPMPFMFEREGDYTELLVPANLLADGAILARAREVLAEDVCDDVEVIGWLYQFYISERKAEVFAGFKKNKKAGAEEIPAVTQLFTPHWIVRYLVENSLGRLWMLNRPASRLADQMEYYIAPVDEEADFLKIGRPEELTVLDPACGSGHMLTYAFDLLYAIYQEAGYAPSEIPELILTHNLHGIEIDPRAGSLAAFALAMKARAKQRTFFNKQVRPDICVIAPITFSPEELDTLIKRDDERHEQEGFWNQFADADTIGSLIGSRPDQTRRFSRSLESFEDDGDLLDARIVNLASQVVGQAEQLARRFAVVVANPPYMGNKQMDDKLREWALAHAVSAKHDLYAMFLYRSQGWVQRGGCIAMVAPHSWMFLSRYEKLRRGVLECSSISSLIHMGARAFGEISGEVVQVAAFTLRADSSSARGTYFRLTDVDSAAGKEKEFLRAVGDPNSHRRYLVSTDRFTDLPGSPVAYWVPDHLAAAFAGETNLNAMAPARKGMVTARNDKFLRLWHEVSVENCGFADYSDRNAARASGKRWFGYVKGGAARRWWGNLDYVVDWKDDGQQLQTERHPTEDRVWATNFNLDFIYRPNVNWGDIGGSAFAARLSAGGQLFDGTGSACFPEANQMYEVLALLNSSSAGAFLEILNPTMHFLAGDIARIPFAGSGNLDTPRKLAAQAVEVAQLDWDQYETSWDFERNPLVGVAGVDQLRLVVRRNLTRQETWAAEMARIERQNDEWWLEYYGGSISVQAAEPRRITLSQPAEDSVAQDFISYAVGCMFGRYSLDEPGLVLASQGATLQNYLEKVPLPLFRPDVDNVIPIVDDGWFEDDIVERLRKFVKVSFGATHFEDNLRFLEESLGVKALRDYFITKAGKSKFYDDHVQRYKKRPIYWLFSSPKGSFNALIYMHRYTPSTASTVLNDYLREYRAKLEIALANAEQAAAGGGSAKEQKEADRLRKVLVELAEYEHDVLYPLARQQIRIDLDDGVKANYPKFYPALKNIAGLEATE